ncbi:PAS domain-containing protein [Aliirhizobium terrae]|uniref:PAS domain-containing protein n=1 Tax=Terrirhizobium terrae TaxID=2926709 RepID=UPI00336A33F4
MRTRATEEILNYWNGLRGARPAPLRADLDPSALRHFLPNLFIVTGSAPATLSFALAGTRICELFDRELRGTDYQAIWGKVPEGAPRKSSTTCCSTSAPRSSRSGYLRMVTIAPMICF